MAATVTQVICDSGDGATASITFDNVTNVMSGFRAVNNSNHPMTIEVRNKVTGQSASRTIAAGRSQNNVNVSSLGITVSELGNYQVQCRWQ